MGTQKNDEKKNEGKWSFSKSLGNLIKSNFLREREDSVMSVVVV